MYRGKGSMKIAFIISLLLISTIHLYQYYYHRKAISYHNEFKNDEISKIVLNIEHNIIGKNVQYEITEEKEIDFFTKMFTNNLDNNRTAREAKLYHFSVILNFHNKSNTNVYAFEVDFDNKKEALRPVTLFEKGDNSGFDGYGFVLEDENYSFYRKIVNYWEKYWNQLQ